MSASPSLASRGTRKTIETIGISDTKPAIEMGGTVDSKGLGYVSVDKSQALREFQFSLQNTFLG